MNDQFVCNTCGCVDALEFAYPSLPMISQDSLECTQCLTGTWHGHFPKRPYDPSKDVVINRASGIGLG